ncbi:F0F1 ATP synthase subunit gamma [Patescibacteria group bacterium]|nr:F0F1 ATP synthase subunit gamma [Patescibacteria group bacterium]
MLNKNILKSDGNFLKDIRNLCISYEQISVMRMRKIKDAVLYTRNFYSQLAQVYVQVKNTYTNQVMTLIKKNKIKDPKKMLLLGKNDKSVSILITANNKLYGDIIDRLYQSFREEIGKKDSDLVIVGSLGKELYESSGMNRPYKYFEITREDNLTLADLKPIVSHIAQYSRINVYFGRYETFFNQIPLMENISGDIRVGEDDEIIKKKFYYFEPDLEKILLFFETQIFANLFKQTAYESQLARFASRVQAMEEALSTIEKEEKELAFQARKANILIEDRKQRERVKQIYFKMKKYD